LPDDPNASMKQKLKVIVASTSNIYFYANSVANEIKGYKL